ncbi:hypothetical protein RK21_02740 [Pseudomonas plecoglossicida]|nr:hypothetical protein RK21_02740 [Pseudomonas plecoglossicida]
MHRGLPLSQTGSPCGGPYSGSCGFWSARRRVALRANGPKRCAAPTCWSVGCSETLGNIFLLYKIFELFISAVKTVSCIALSALREFLTGY